MTYKHINFVDSAVMRSLERVASEKGLIKEDRTKLLHKTASSKQDLKTSDDFVDNLLKLCSGLRSCDLEKYAEELEKNYLNFKQAQTLYQAHKETGEDLINSAHPQGSHKLENVDSDEAVIETILDQHLKILETINKKPTGKLSSASEIIRAVKVVLGQDNQLEHMRLSEALTEVNNIYKNMVAASKWSQNLPFESLWQFNHNAKEIYDETTVLSKNPNLINYEKLDDIKTDLLDIKGIVRIKPSDPNDAQVYSNMLNEVESALVSIENAIQYVNGAFDKYLIEKLQNKDLTAKRKEKEETAKLQKTQKPLQNLKDLTQYNIDNLTDMAIKLNKYEELIKKSNYAAADKEYAINYIDERRSALNEINGKFKNFSASLSESGIDLDQKKTEYNQLATEASQRMQEVNLFNQKWVAPLGKS